MTSGNSDPANPDAAAPKQAPQSLMSRFGRRARATQGPGAEGVEGVEGVEGAEDTGDTDDASVDELPAEPLICAICHEDIAEEEERVMATYGPVHDPGCSSQTKRVP